MKTFLIPLLIICVAGIVGSELMLVYAMVKKNAAVTTRTAGKYILIFLAALTVVVMLLMGIGQREAAQGSAASAEGVTKAAQGGAASQESESAAGAVQGSAASAEGVTAAAQGSAASVESIAGTA